MTGGRGRKIRRNCNLTILNFGAVCHLASDRKWILTIPRPPRGTVLQQITILQRNQAMYGRVTDDAIQRMSPALFFAGMRRFSTAFFSELSERTYESSSPLPMHASDFS